MSLRGEALGEILQDGGGDAAAGGGLPARQSGHLRVRGPAQHGGVGRANRTGEAETRSCEAFKLKKKKTAAAVLARCQVVFFIRLLKIEYFSVHVHSTMSLMKRLHHTSYGIRTHHTW